MHRQQNLSGRRERSWALSVETSPLILILWQIPSLCKTIPWNQASYRHNSAYDANRIVDFVGLDRGKPCFPVKEWMRQMPGQKMSTVDATCTHNISSNVENQVGKPARSLAFLKHKTTSVLKTHWATMCTHHPHTWMQLIPHILVHLGTLTSQ